MRRRFADISLEPVSLERGELDGFINTARHLGFHCIGFRFQPRQLSRLGDCRGVAVKYGLDYVSRLSLTLNRISEIKNALRKFRRRVEVVSLETGDRALLAFGCRDRRVDILTIPPGKKVFLSKGSIRHILSQDKALEFLARPIIVGDGRVKVMESYMATIPNLIARNVKIVFSSGATSPGEMRGPRETAALLTVLGVEHSKALDTVSTNVWGLVERNRFKLSKRFVMPGVSVVEEEDENS